MTEKRFVLQDLDILCRVLDNGKPINGIETVHLLNKFYEENEQLKKILGFLKNDNAEDILNVLNSQENRTWELKQENKQLKQQRKELLRLIENNIEIYENINTNVEFHQGEIQGKLTVLNNLREVILND